MLLSRLATLFTTLISQSAIFSTHSAKSTVYLIRHAEKDPDGSIGLNDRGWIRAQCLTHVFGPHSPYNIGYIIVEQPLEGGIHERSFQTVTPLAAVLNLTVDTSCDKYDHECAADLVRAYNGPGNILICWQHGKLRKIMMDLGGQNVPRYPDDRNDIIWTASEDWNSILKVQSECCPELDTC